MPLLLAGCERLDYTTWVCQAPNLSEKASEKPLRMKLDGSQLEVRGEILRFCGSLGLSSYFDQNCPHLVETSKASFMTKTGEFKFNQEHYLCKVL
jgi:hypothetical protein